jgi:hypothetical protein
LTFKAEERTRQHYRTFYERTTIRHRFTPRDVTSQNAPSSQNIF